MTKSAGTRPLREVAYMGDIELSRAERSLRMHIDLLDRHVAYSPGASLSYYLNAQTRFSLC